MHDAVMQCGVRARLISAHRETPAQSASNHSKITESMGSGWSSGTGSQSSEDSSDEPFKHLVTEDDGSVIANAECNAAVAFDSTSLSLLAQPKPNIGVGTPQEGIPSTKHGVASGSCAWSIDVSDWAGKRKKSKGEKRPKGIARRPALAASRSIESGHVEGTPPLLPVVELRADCEVGKLATSPEDLSTRKCLDLKRW